MPDRQSILLIGGNGFYGRAIAARLVHAGHRVHVASRHTDPGKRDGIDYHRAGQDDTEVMPALLAECATIVHLASTTTPGSSARHPAVDTEENLLPATRLIDMMATYRPRRLIFVSSGGSIYGNPLQCPVDETAEPRPLSYHAAGKLALEALFGVFAQANDVSLAVLRPSNLYGPGQQLQPGFGLVRTLLDKALRNEPVEVWGDGSAQRDYLFIADAAAACQALIEEPGATGIFNLGSGNGTSISEMIAHVELVAERGLQIKRRPARTTDVYAIVLDPGRLTRTTGWTPNTGLVEGLHLTWDWVRRNRG